MSRTLYQLEGQQLRTVVSLIEKAQCDMPKVSGTLDTNIALDAARALLNMYLEYSETRQEEC